MRCLLCPILIFFLPFCWSKESIADKVCPTNQGATLDSVQGKVFVDPEYKGHWQQAQLDDFICEGSRIRVETYSRASITLTNGVVLRLDEGTVLSLNGISPDKPTLLDLLNGFIHFISRTPTHLEITSPIANAGPEGTEFAMRVDDKKASLWVYEGGVKFFNDKGSVHLKPGEGAQAILGQAPKTQIDIKPQDAVNWALYYPPILPYPEAATPIDPEIRTAIQDFRQGRVDDALIRLDALSPAKRSPYFYKVRGAIRLTAGRVPLAVQDIQVLLITHPNDAEALALQSVLTLTQNRKEEAYTLSNRAIMADPHSASAFSVLSYTEQARFQLDKALEAANQAVKIAPHDAMVWARKAELELSKGLTSESQQTSKRALALDADLERTQTVTGFSYLLRMDTDEALQAFEKAVKLDSTSPLARLGLGLAKIRKGDLKKGRQDLEIAAILDPNNSLVRSYLGKAYYEERRSSLAEDQFSLAKERDPKDPTPYFYDAINKQTTNRPVEALHDMQKAIDLNDNRAVYRSNLFLDKDAAARTANLSRIYNDLGFGRVALKEAWKALGYDATNPSAHRFLSDAYIGQPRYRVARASELLQAQLLQPINITPVQPQLTGENIGILNSTGPGSLSLTEYDPLYNANGAHVVLNGAYGSNNTKTDNAILSGVYDKLSLSLGQFHYQTDGFRKNDDYQQNVYDAFAQYAFTPDFSLQFELKSEDISAGDVPFRLNDSAHKENLRLDIKQDTVRVGGHYKIDFKNDLIASAFYTTLKDNSSDRRFRQGNISPQNDANIFTFEKSKNKTFQSEIQHIFHSVSFDITTGAGYLNTQNDTFSERLTRRAIFPFDVSTSKNPAFSFSIPSQHETHYFNAYSYSKQYLLPNLTTILGVSFDSYNDEQIDRKQINPKVGVIWNPFKKLTLRSAFFRSLKRTLASNQTIEPTQVAGFNQFFDANNGSTAWQGGFGLDYNPVESIFFGGEVTWRDGKQPVSETIEGKAQLVDQGRNEAAHLAYFYWLPVEWISFRSEYRYEIFSRDFKPGSGDLTNPRSIETQQVPFTISLFYDNGFFEKFTGTYVNQQVELVTDDTRPDNRLEKDSVNFWTFDAALGFRLPKKFGIISFEVRNLFDNRFNYQSSFDASGPQLTPFVPERQLYGKLSLFY